jgi:hypothetical protein
MSIKRKILKGHNILMAAILAASLVFLIIGLSGNPEPVKPIPLPVYYDKYSIDFNWVGC